MTPASSKFTFSSHFYIIYPWEQIQVLMNPKLIQFKGSSLRKIKHFKYTIKYSALAGACVNGEHQGVYPTGFQPISGHRPPLALHSRHICLLSS